jgi:DNA topoisomerase I
MTGRPPAGEPFAAELFARAVTAGGVLGDVLLDAPARFADYDPSKHPHVPAGSPEGGEFQPTGGGGKGPAAKGGKKADVPIPKKAPAVKGAMAPARRVGAGKDARLVMADGSAPPAHVAAGKIPPQWADVRVSLDPRADVLATGRDAAGRAKMVYRDEFHMRNAAAKFARTRDGLSQAAALHAENQANRADPKLKEEADCTYLMQRQATRPGSDTDTKAKVKAYGATTLRAEHVVEAEDGVRLRFIGKEGVAHDHLIGDPKLAAMLLERKATAGERGGQLFKTSYDKVARYAKTLDAGKFSPKDFRTIRANQLAVAEIAKNPTPPANNKEYKARVKAVAEKVSGVLGNEPAQALASYIDPVVFSQWKVAKGA